MLPVKQNRFPSVPREGEVSFGTCPQCQLGFVRQTPKGAGCNRWKEGCNFSIWRDIYGKEITDTHIKELVEKKGKGKWKDKEN